MFHSNALHDGWLVSLEATVGGANTIGFCAGRFVARYSKPQPTDEKTFPLTTGLDEDRRRAPVRRERARKRIRYSYSRESVSTVTLFCKLVLYGPRTCVCARRGNVPVMYYAL